MQLRWFSLDPPFIDSPKNSPPVHRQMLMLSTLGSAIQRDNSPLLSLCFPNSITTIHLVQQHPKLFPAVLEVMGFARSVGSNAVTSRVSHGGEQSRNGCVLFGTDNHLLDEVVLYDIFSITTVRKFGLLLHFCSVANSWSVKSCGSK